MHQQTQKMRILLTSLLLCGIAAVSTAQECGIQKIVPFRANKIIGGEEARPHSWPWAVMLGHRHGTAKHFYRCGAVIIDKHWILTAAHCLGDTDDDDETTLDTNPVNYHIRVGNHRRNEPWEATSRTYNIKRIIAHELYDVNRFDRDVALLEVDGTIEFSDYVQPVCLPDIDTEPAVGSEIVVVGWGTTRYSTSAGTGADLAPYLKQVEVQVRHRDICDLHYSEPIKKDMICAGTVAGQNSCNGDSGGPVVGKDATGKYVVHGLVSFGKGCSIGGAPSLYTRVGYYMHWIKQKMSEPECGKPKIAPNEFAGERVQGRVEAKPGSWPWTAQLAFRAVDTDPYTYKCGATIINDKWLLTAANCLMPMHGIIHVQSGAPWLYKSPANYQVRIGHFHFNGSDSTAGVHSVRRVLSMPSGTNTLNADRGMVLLELQGAIQFNDQVSPVCLPTSPADPVSGTRCVAAGWNVVREQHDDHPILATLHQVQVDVVDRATCQRVPDYGTRVENSMFCAGSVDGKDTCAGDTGGPLVCRRKVSDSYVLTGVSTWSEGCHDAALPGVYIRVGDLVPWINTVVYTNAALDDDEEEMRTTTRRIPPPPIDDPRPRPNGGSFLESAAMHSLVLAVMIVYNAL